MNGRTWRLERFALERRGGVLPDVVLLIGPADHRRNARGGRYYPHHGHVDAGTVGRPALPVPDRKQHGGAVPDTVPDWKHGSREPIGCDDTEVPDGRRAVEDVDDQPRVADHTPEDPPSQTLVGGGQR